MHRNGEKRLPESKENVIRNNEMIVELLYPI